MYMYMFYVNYLSLFLVLQIPPWEHDLPETGWTVPEAFPVHPEWGFPDHSGKCLIHIHLTLPMLICINHKLTMLKLVLPCSHFEFTTLYYFFLRKLLQSCSPLLSISRKWLLIWINYYLINSAGMQFFFKIRRMLMTYRYWVFDAHTCIYMN